LSAFRVRLIAVLLLASLGVAAPTAPVPAATGPAAAAPRAVVVDAQVVAVGADRYALRIRSSEPQAFDVVPGATTRRVTVRLYRATLGLTSLPEPAAFGLVTFREEPAGNVLVIVDLVDASYRVAVTHGGNPGLVEIRIGR